MTVSYKAKARGKITFIKIIIAGLMLIFVTRLVWLQIIAREKFLTAAERQQNTMIDLQAKRGKIYDRNMRILAEDIDSYTYYVVPENISDKYKAAQQLKKITGKSGWLAKFKKHPRFLFVARKTSKKLEDRFEKTDIQTLSRFVEPKRVYPCGSLALPVLGRVDVDNKGLSGVELQFNDYLSGQDGKATLKRDGLGKCYLFNEQPVVVPQPGNDIVTTLDLNLQQIAEQEIASALRENNALRGIGLFLKAGTGEILACAVLDSMGEASVRNRAVVDQYEPGSTFKLITVAQALLSGRFELNEKIYVEEGKFRIGRRTIRDDHEFDTLTVGDVLVHSSNIGVSKMALTLGEQTMYRAIKEAGFIERLGVDFPGEAPGYIESPSWREHYLANISFGHGVSASPLQIVSLYNAVASDGYLYKPFFCSEMVKPDGSRSCLTKNHRLRKVFSPDIINTLTGLLRQVVDDGTATKAKSQIVSIAGKTGTALKLREEGRGYDHRKAMASFAGFFPVNNPMVVGVIIFDEPKTSRYGGETSAPVFKKIAERYYQLPQQMMERYVDSESQTETPEVNAEFASADYDAEYSEAMERTLPYKDYHEKPDEMPDFAGLTVRQALKLAGMVGIDCDIKGSGIVKRQTPRAGVNIGDTQMITLICED